MALYSDGHGYCFGRCDSLVVPGDDSRQHVARHGGAWTPQVGEFVALTSRGINVETCRKYGYAATGSGDKRCHIAPYYSKGKLVAQHLRFPNKDFKWIGRIKDGCELFGQHLYKGGGKILVVTEGEIDCLSMAQMQGLKWPVVSVPSGASSAPRYIAENVEFLESFERVVFMLDNDEPGQEAAVRCAEVLSPGKAFIAKLPLKDANDMLKEGRVAECISAMWDAVPWRPDGVVNLADYLEAILAPMPEGPALPFPKLNQMIHGLQPGRLVTITAGTGTGKTCFCTELGYHLAFVHDLPGGHIALEGSVTETGQRYLGIKMNLPLFVPGTRVDNEEATMAFRDTLGTGRVSTYDHFGSLDPDVLMSRLRYMVKSLGAKWLILDHVSILISGLEIDDERKALDIIMTRLRSFVEETKITLFLVSHLNRTKSQSSHEQGLEVNLSHLRGSQAIAQLSDFVIALERDQQADDEEERNTTKIRVLKNRLSGQTGTADTLSYDPKTGRLFAMFTNEGEM